MAIMHLEILTFCDAATESGGRLNLLGVADTILANELPVKVPHCALVARLRAIRGEAGEHTMRLMVIDADGRSVLNVDGKLALHFPAGAGAAVNLIVNAQNLEFKAAGEYALDLAVDGVQLGSTPLFVRVRQ
jgi:hypothetical protein